MRISLVSEDIARVQISRDGVFTDTGLNRYGFILQPDDTCAEAEIIAAEDDFSVENGRIRVEVAGDRQTLKVTDLSRKQCVLNQTGFAFDAGQATARFRAEKDEDWAGFGDQTRERLFHRGHQADLWVRNVNSYIPVPFFMSTRGVGILVNTTHHIVFDMCKSDADQFTWRDARGAIDYYVMVGNGFRELLGVYTGLTGRPKLPPVWSFGLWYICRTHANDYEAANDAWNFRREEIPCDVIGLEPGWMETFHDLSVEKKWSGGRFPIPDYWPKMEHHFFDVLKRMGYRLELWLNNEYDLSYEAERRACGEAKDVKRQSGKGSFHDAGEVDTRLNSQRPDDKITRKDQPWFGHLKKFVDQKVDFFKQDGAFQVCDHPDRVWGNGMLDAEMHNLYPLLYARQMYEGFAEYAKRRPVVFTPNGWAGFQAWCGTWTGDTGGRLDTLGAMLNTSLVGHAWSTNDMEVADKRGIHLGYLLPWSQINSWNYFRMPWLQGPELLETHKFYSRLRARLIPYIYSYARRATQTGYPLMVPLALEFESDANCKEILHQYFLGRDLLVCIYKQEAYFPEGRWKDFWTGEVIDGSQQRAIRWPDNRGGGLYVRAGGIVPFGPVMQYRGERPTDEMELYVFPDTQETSIEFYEDDGVSFGHLSGEFAVTPISTVDTGKEYIVKVGKTAGRYDGQPGNRRWAFSVAVDRPPEEALVNGEPLSADDWHFDAVQKLVHLSPLPGPVSVSVR